MRTESLFPSCKFLCQHLFAHFRTLKPKKAWERVPECNFSIMQPSFWLCKVASWPSSPMRVTFSGKYPRWSRRTTNSNGGLPVLRVCACDSDGFIKASPSKRRFVALYCHQWRHMAVRVCFSAFLRHCCLSSPRLNVSLVLTSCTTKAVFLLYAKVILISHGEFMTKTGS